MTNDCELLSKCGFFNKFQGNSEVLKAGWIRLFCSDLDQSAKCARKKIRLATGQPPVDNMAPTGKLV